MRISANGIAVAHYFEQCRLVAYPDPGSKDGKPWTIGWGHTGPEVVKGLVWTQAQADAAFVQDLDKFERAVLKCVKVTLNQGQFDALVLLAYNIGADAFGKSTLVRILNNENYGAVPPQFARWNKNDGKVMRGLIRRRVAEAALWAGKSGAEAIAIGVKAA